MVFSLLSPRFNDTEKYATVQVNSEEESRKISVRRRTEPSVSILKGHKYVPSCATDIRNTLEKFKK